MPPVLEPPLSAACKHVRTFDWRGQRKVQPREWSTHGVDEGERSALTERRLRSFRKPIPTIPGLSALDEIIEDSRAILEIELDEDEAQIPYAEETWARAVEFLRRTTKWVCDTLGRVVDLPDILPGPDGSIDLHWDHSEYEMLINIPADPNDKAGFYGDDRGELFIKGKFDSNTFNHGLLLWLARVK